MHHRSGGFQANLFRIALDSHSLKTASHCDNRTKYRRFDQSDKQVCEWYDFADALHWACSRGCERFVTFDDRRLVRRARRLRLAPEIALAR